MPDDFAEFDFLEVDVGRPIRGPSPRSGPDEPSPGRRRWPWVAGTVAVAVVVVVVSVGTSSSDHAAGPTTLTRPPPTLGPASTLRDLSVPVTPSTSEAASTSEATTTTVREVGATFPDLPAKTGLHLVVLFRDRITTVDVDARSLTSEVLPAKIARDGTSLVTGPDWAVYQEFGGGTWLAEGTKSIRALHGAYEPGGQVFPGPEGLVWQTDSAHRRVVLTDRFGIAVYRSHSLQQVYSVIGDGDANVLLTGVGGAYLASDGDLFRLTTGQVLASGDGLYLVDECSEQLDCASVLINPRTGEHRVLPGAPVPPNGGFGTISPNGTTAAFQSPDGAAIDLVDLADGTLTTVPFDGRGDISQGIAWSADSRYLVYLDGSAIMILDRQHPTATYRIKFGNESFPVLVQVQPAA